MLNGIASGSIRKLFANAYAKTPTGTGGLDPAGQELPVGKLRQYGEVGMKTGMGRLTMPTSVTRSELRSLIEVQLATAGETEGGLEKLAKSIDADGNGVINKDELTGYLAKVAASKDSNVKVIGGDDPTASASAASSATKDAEKLTRRESEAKVSEIVKQLGALTQAEARIAYKAAQDMIRTKDVTSI
jgi:hypothetical protein